VRLTSPARFGKGATEKGLRRYLVGALLHLAEGPTEKGCNRSTSLAAYSTRKSACGVDVRPQREDRSKGSRALAIDDEAGTTDRSFVSCTRLSMRKVAEDRSNQNAHLVQKGAHQMYCIAQQRVLPSLSREQATTLLAQAALLK
jgi:hypothetical protein